MKESISGISLSKEHDNTIFPGDTIKINASTAPENPLNPGLLWSSENENIATVSQEGVVTAISPGTAAIKAQSQNGSINVSDTILVDVSTPAETISFRNNHVVLEVGSDFTFYGILHANGLIKLLKNPSNAVIEPITWATSDPSVVSLDEKELHAIKAGTAIITATEVNGKTATIEIKVRSQLESISISPSSTELSVGQTQNLQVIPTPEDLGNIEATWTNQNPDIVQLSYTGTSNNNIVTALKAGTATITAEVNGKTATCTIVVNEIPVVESITFDENELNLKLNESKKLEPTISPETAENKHIPWPSSDSSILQVLEDGTIIGKKYGSAQITATSDNNVTATITVNVVKDGLLEEEYHGEMVTRYYIDGITQKGFQEYNGQLYYFSEDTGILMTGWNESEEGIWYQNENGEVVTGHQEIDGNKYYFNDQGIMQKGFVTIDDKIYFYSRVTGALKTGWQGSTEGQWYQNEDGEVVTGQQEIDGNKYYFNDQGIMQKGFVTIDDKIYFYSRVTGTLKTGWQGSTEGQWYQTEDGEVVTGIQEIDGNKYYFNDQGIMQKGFVTIDDKIYFYSRVTGVLKTGWQGSTEGQWYQNEDGEVVTGHQQIDGNKYYFNDQGIVQKGFVTIDDKIYFYSRVTGALKTGWQGSTEGQWYQTEDGEVVTGKQEINGNKYYFNDQGIMQKGFVTIDDKIYFYSRANGVLKTGWQGSDEGVWYQNEDGELLKGPQTIDGRDYVFNEETGLLEGFEIVNGKKYYYNPDGTQAKGTQYMAGGFWQFNSITGAFEKYVRQIRVIDISSHNGVINWETVKASGHQRKLLDGVILRLGYGIGYMDSMFIRNKNELERLGIPYSVYLFSYAENGWEALRESNFVIEAIRNNNVHIASNLFGIYYDLEDWEIRSTGENSYGISQNAYRDMITTFVDNVEKNLCIRTRVYASKNYILERFPSDVQGYATWVAQWYHEFTYQGPYEGWQYTSDGSVPGINGRVDMNYFYV